MVDLIVSKTCPNGSKKHSEIDRVNWIKKFTWKLLRLLRVILRNTNLVLNCYTRFSCQFYWLLNFAAWTIHSRSMIRIIIYGVLIILLLHIFGDVDALLIDLEFLNKMVMCSSPTFASHLCGSCVFFCLFLLYKLLYLSRLGLGWWCKLLSYTLVKILNL